MTKNPSSSRVVQTETGTWLASWCGVPGNTPPIEKREWFCLACFKKSDELWRSIPPEGFINWEEVEKRIGPDDTKNARNFIKNHIPSVWERIKSVEELGLKTDVYCKDCGTVLNSAAEALVEVY